MSQPMSWRAHISVCVTAIALTLSALPASANGQKMSLFGSAQKARTAQTQQVSVDPEDLRCMTEALYYEARGEGVAGQKAVAEVILNRVDNPRFPTTVCGVINQRGQFSYKGRVSNRYSEKAAFRLAQNIAAAALAGEPRNLTGGATYFHTRSVRPNWSRQFFRTTQIGSHIFYATARPKRLASN